MVSYLTCKSPRRGVGGPDLEGSIANFSLVKLVGVMYPVIPIQKQR